MGSETTFYLIRHGHTDAVGRFLSGRMPGVALSARGRAETEEMAASLPCVQALYSSPQTRTQETAAAIARRFGLTVLTEAALDEIDFGDWTGRSFAELEQDPAWRGFNERRGSAPVPHGESARAAAERVVAFLTRLARLHHGESAALVTHGDVIKAALFHCDGRPLDDMPTTAIPTASVHRLVWTPSGRPVSAAPIRVAPALYVFDVDGTLRYTTVPGQPCPYRPDQWQLMPRVREILRAIDWSPRGAALGVVSNQDAVAAGRLTAASARAMIEATVREAVGVLPARFTIEICTCDPDAGCACRKPSPAMLMRVARRFGIAPERALYVGDLETDREAARRAGMPFVWAQRYFGSGD